LVENLAWSADWILQTCEEPLRKKIIEGIVGISPMDSGDPLILKLMLDIIMDVDNSALCAITTSLQTLWLKDVPGENVCTAVSYLKGVLILLKNYSELPTDTTGLLNDIIISADCDEFSGFMNSVYYDYTQKIRLIDHSKSLRLAKAEYCTLYRKQRRMALVSNLAFRFFVGDTNTQGSCTPGGRGGRQLGDRGGRGEGG